jgi:hypothetical protein
VSPAPISRRLLGLACALVLAVGCEPVSPLRGGDAHTARVETWIVARDPAVARTVATPAAPALATRVVGSGTVPVVLPAARVQVTATVVGPLATIERTKSYASAPVASDAFVTFTAPAAPARQDLVVRAGGHRMSILVRDRQEAESLARDDAHAKLVDADDAGTAQLPLGTLPAGAGAEVTVETVGIVPWHEGAYELTVPRAPDGDVALAADLYGPGPIVVVSSPSHAIDVSPDSLDHLRVTLRDPATLHDDDFVLRYRSDTTDRPGILVAQRDGAGEILGVVLHPVERDHECVRATDVTIDWNGTPVTEIRPAIDQLPAGQPLVVLARSSAHAAGPITVRARVGRDLRSFVVMRDDRVPAASLAALPVLWSRAAPPTVTARR